MLTSYLTRATGIAGLATVLAACAADADPELTEAADAMPEPAATATSPHDEPSATAEAPAASATPSESGAPVEVPAPLDFTATTLADGAEFAGASLAGTDAILWAWAAWCPTCQAEAPDVAEAAAELPEGVTLYGLPGRDTAEASQGFVDDYALGSFDHIFDEDGSLWAGFEIAYQPAFVLINDDGSIETVPGALDADGIVAAAEELAAS